MLYLTGSCVSRNVSVHEARNRHSKGSLNIALIIKLLHDACRPFQMQLPRLQNKTHTTERKEEENKLEEKAHQETTRKKPSRKRKKKQTFAGLLRSAHLISICRNRSLHNPTQHQQHKKKVDSIKKKRKRKEKRKSKNGCQKKGKRKEKMGQTACHQQFAAPDWWIC